MRTNTHRRSWLAAPLCCLAVLGACGSDESARPGEAATADVRGVTDTEILLGMHTDLSGPTAIYGVGSVNGVRMRFDEANAAGGIHGRQIRLIVEDTGYTVPRAIQATSSSSTATRSSR